MNGCAARHVRAIPSPKRSAHDRRPASGNGSKPSAHCQGPRAKIFADPLGIGVKAGKSSRTSCSQAVGRKEYSEESGRAWRSHGRSSRFRRKLFHGPRYLAQTGGTSRTALRETAIGHRDGPRDTNLRPRPPLLSHRELVSGPFCYSKYSEVDGSLLARTPEYTTHSRQAQRRYVQGVTTAF